MNEPEKLVVVLEGVRLVEKNQLGDGETVRVVETAEFSRYQGALRSAVISSSHSE